VVPWSLAALPRYWPGEDGATGDERPMRRWRVLHACDVVGATAAVAEAQIEAGMRPSILTKDGWYRPPAAGPEPPSALSLIHEWQQVRRWRQGFIDEMVDDWCEVLHAHCFAGAMAGVRGNAAVVYDMVAAIGAGVSPKPGAWLLRSLRVAEQFALTRAGAVVVHSHALWAEALQRGIEAENLFLVPDPLEAADFRLRDEHAHGGRVTLFAPSQAYSDGGELILKAFAMLNLETENVRLLLEAAPDAAKAVRERVAQAGLAGAVEMIGMGEHGRALEEADIVIAGAPANDAPGAALISGLAHGCAVLAADVPQNREVTPQGRGCLWYRDGDAHDLAGRAASLARNRGFRAALGLSGRAHLQATRSPKIIARKYDEVYRHAYQRRHRGGSDMLRKLEIAQACF